MVPVRKYYAHVLFFRVVGVMLTSWHYSSKLPQTGWLPTEISTVLEGVSLKSRCCQAVLPRNAVGSCCRELFLAFSGLLLPQESFGLFLHHSISASVFMPFSSMSVL